MILGLGNDLCDIRRIEKSLERFGDRFVQRIFTEISTPKTGEVTVVPNSGWYRSSSGWAISATADRDQLGARRLDVDGEPSARW